MRVRSTQDAITEIIGNISQGNIGCATMLMEAIKVMNGMEWGYFAGVLNNRNLPEVVAEIKRRNLWLFDVWGYLPSGTAQGVSGLWRMPDGVTEMPERELGDRWLGMDNGEQDGRWAGDAAPGVNRFDRMLSFQRYFEHMDRKLGNRMAALVSLNYGHYFLRENCYTMIGAETAQALPNSQVYYAFCRGAGKQYGVPWFGNVSIYNR